MPETPFMPEEPMGMPMEPELAPEEAPEGLESITFSALDLPQVVDWEEGQEYDVTMRVRMTNKEERDGVMAADFDIISADAGTEEPPIEPPMEEPMGGPMGGPMMPPV